MTYVSDQKNTPRGVFCLILFVDLLYYAGEDLWMIFGESGKDLAIKTDVRFLERADHF